MRSKSAELSGAHRTFPSRPEYSTCNGRVTPLSRLPPPGERRRRRGRAASSEGEGSDVWGRGRRRWGGARRHWRSGGRLRSATCPSIARSSQARPLASSEQAMNPSEKATWHCLRRNQSLLRCCLASPMTLPSAAVATPSPQTRKMSTTLRIRSCSLGFNWCRRVPAASPRWCQHPSSFGRQSCPLANVKGTSPRPLSLSNTIIATACVESETCLPWVR